MAQVLDHATLQAIAERALDGWGPLRRAASTDLYL